MLMKTTCLTALIFSIVLFGCKKDQRTPPTLELLNANGSALADTSVIAPNYTLTLTVKGTKTEDELKTLNVSYQYDGATSTTTKETMTLQKSEYEGFTTSYTIKARNQSGSEKWTFTLTDRDGNMASKSTVILVP